MTRAKHKPNTLMSEKRPFTSRIPISGRLALILGIHGFMRDFDSSVLVDTHLHGGIFRDDRIRGVTSVVKGTNSRDDGALAVTPQR